MRKKNKIAINLESKFKQIRFKEKSYEKKDIHKRNISVVRKRWKAIYISEERLDNHFSEVKVSMSQLKTILGDFY